MCNLIAGRKIEKFTKSLEGRVNESISLIREIAVKAEKLHLSTGYETLEHLGFRVNTFEELNPSVRIQQLEAGCNKTAESDVEPFATAAKQVNQTLSHLIKK